MVQVQLKLTEDVHDDLDAQARQAGVPLRQYLVNILVRHAETTYTVQPVAASVVAEQAAEYAHLLRDLGSASHEEIRAILDEREAVEPDPGLTPETVRRLQAKIAARSARGRGNS